MEKELIKKYKSIDKRIRSLEDHGQVEKDDVREALHGLVDEMDKENVSNRLILVLSPCQFPHIFILSNLMPQDLQYYHTNTKQFLQMK
jgi:hypothetical protein